MRTENPGLNSSLKDIWCTKSNTKIVLKMYEYFVKYKQINIWQENSWRIVTSKFAHFKIPLKFYLFWTCKKVFITVDENIIGLPK